MSAAAIIASQDSAVSFLDWLIFMPFLPSNNASSFTYLIIFFLLAVSYLYFFPGGIAWFFCLVAKHCQNPIPGPRGFFSILSGPNAHRTLASLAAEIPDAGKLMSFSVGFTPFVVSSRPDTAKEMLNSAAFADRPIKESAYELLFHRAMGFAPYGEYWRKLRRISATYLFSPRRIIASGAHRSVIGEKMVADVRRAMSRDGKLEVRRILHFGSLNSVMAAVFGRIYDFNGEEGRELESLVKEGYELLGTFNWADHLPFLAALDLKGVRRRCRALVKRVTIFVGGILEARKARKKLNGDSNVEDGDFVDVLLCLEGDEKLSDADMIAVLWEMIFRGTDTVAILLEWIMARMVLHQDIQNKAQAEIDAVVGKSRSVTDSDVVSLPYLQAIVKESLRVHPPGPLLSWARLAIHDVHVGGHLVPAGTTAMVNMWSITHDASIWPEPNLFLPDRFMTQDVSVLGSDLKLAPFGAGRRVCPGKAMGLATVHLWLAQLLQRFRWFPVDCGVDLSECLKMSLELEKPLTCKAIPR